MHVFRSHHEEMDISRNSQPNEWSFLKVWPAFLQQLRLLYFSEEPYKKGKPFWECISEQCSNVTFHRFKKQTSSRVSTLPSTLGFDLLASFGAFTFDRQSCLSGGGPPRGWPRITTLSPERTYVQRDNKSDYHWIWWQVWMSDRGFAM